MNEWEFNEPDDEEAAANEHEESWRLQRLFDAVQTFAPEYKVFPKAWEIIWWRNN